MTDRELDVTKGGCSKCNDIKYSFNFLKDGCLITCCVNCGKFLKEESDFDILNYFQNKVKKIYQFEEEDCKLISQCIVQLQDDYDLEQLDVTLDKHIDEIKLGCCSYEELEDITGNNKEVLFKNGWRVCSDCYSGVAVLFDLSFN